MEEIYYKGVLFDSMSDLARMKGIKYLTLRRLVLKRVDEGFECSFAIEEAVKELVNKVVEEAIRDGHLHCRK